MFADGLEVRRTLQLSVDEALTSLVTIETLVSKSHAMLCIGNRRAHEDVTRRP